MNQQNSIFTGRPIVSFEVLQKKAEENNALLYVPPFNVHPDELEKNVLQGIEETDKALDELAQRPTSDITFENSVLALDQTFHQGNIKTGPVFLLWNIHPDPEVRQKAQELIEKIDEWDIKTDYRKDLYQMVKNLSAKSPDLEPRDQRLLDRYLEDYELRGLHLPEADQETLKEIKEKLAKLEIQFEENIKNAKPFLKLTQKEVEGLPQDYLNQWKTQDGNYEVNCKLNSHFLPLMRLAKNEDIRKKAEYVRGNIAKKENLNLLEEILTLRSQIKDLLGHNNWAEYKLKQRMAQTPNQVFDFLNQLNEGLETKVQSEIARLKKLKATELNQDLDQTEFNSWDTDYFFNQLAKNEYDVDLEKIKAYFPLEQTIRGMFQTFEKVLDIQIDEVVPPQRWHEEVLCFVVSDAPSQNPLGVLYFDLFPREGKYSHFALFSILDGAQLENEMDQRPVSAIIGNFTRGHEGAPSLLFHEEVKTLFHEFGHAMHSLLTQVPHAKFSGTSVPRDFVEVPSQVFEHWVWDAEVLKHFAFHHQNPQEHISEETLEKMDQARKARMGRDYRFQLALSLIDMEFHSKAKPQKAAELNQLANERLTQALTLPLQDNTSFICRFGHLIGYDAGYYSYLWSKVISSDIASLFESKEDKYLSIQAGQRFRHEILEQGSIRPVEDSIAAFLGREQSLKPFFREVGIN